MNQRHLAFRIDAIGKVPHGKDLPRRRELDCREHSGRQSELSPRESEHTPIGTVLELQSQIRTSSDERVGCQSGLAQPRAQQIRKQGRVRSQELVLEVPPHRHGIDARLKHLELLAIQTVALAGRAAPVSEAERQCLTQRLC